VTATAMVIVVVIVAVVVTPLTTKLRRLVRHIGLIEMAGRSLSPAAQQFASAVSDACRAMT